MDLLFVFFFIPPLNYPVRFIADLLTGYLAVLPSLILVYYIIHTCTLHISSLSPLSMTGTSALNELNRSALHRDVTDGSSEVCLTVFFLGCKFERFVADHVSHRSYGADFIFLRRFHSSRSHRRPVHAPWSVSCTLHTHS